MDKNYIERKDGIKYYKNSVYNTEHYDKKITIRIKDEKLVKLKKYSESKGIKYQSVIKNIINDFIEKEEL